MQARQFYIEWESEYSETKRSPGLDKEKKVQKILQRGSISNTRGLSPIEQTIQHTCYKF